MKAIAQFLSYLKCHPFPVVAHFDRVVAVSFAFPEDLLQSMLPQGLIVDSYHGLGFVTVAMVWTRGLRPSFLPRFCGKDFFLAGTRIFARLENESGRRLRGLSIVRSETDRRFMVHSGNLMTGYRYRLIEATLRQNDSGKRVQCVLPEGQKTLDLSFIESEGDLPDTSPFSDWKKARQFAGPMPFTFSPRGNREFTVVEGSRRNWTPRPVKVIDWKVSLFEEPEFSGVLPILANAFMVEDIPYRWGKGQVMRARKDDV